MVNKFSKFLSVFTNADSVVSELDTFVGSNQGKLKNNSGGSGSLGVELHRFMQQSISTYFACQITPLTDTELRTTQQACEKLLYRQMLAAVDGLTTIDETSGLTSHDVVTHIITNVYNPLFDLAKDVNSGVILNELRANTPTQRGQNFGFPNP